MKYLLMFAFFMLFPALELVWGLIFGRNKFVWSKWFWQLARFVILYVILITIWELDIPYVMDDNWSASVSGIIIAVAYLLIEKTIEKMLNKNKK